MDSPKSRSLSYRRLRAPRGDSEVLLSPSWTECLAQTDANRRAFRRSDCTIGGKALKVLRQEIRAEMLSLARAHCARYVEAGANPTFSDSGLSDAQRSDESPIVLSGHQPRLFHPGVWAKNFAAARLATECSGIAIHVIIDNDDFRTQSIQVPTGSKLQPRITVEPFDIYSDPIPFENRYARDANILESFPARVAAAVESLTANPLVGSLWPDVLNAVERGQPLGLAFAEARHKIELRWGLRSLDVPLSQLCETDAFLRFALHLIGSARAVTNSYNTRLAEYRQLHRLRNAAHPLPDLAIDTDWYESPFWIWTDEDPQRKALWCRSSGDDLLLGAGTRSPTWTLPNALRTPDEGLESIRECAEHGLKIRPRALTNTMFLRLLCGDTFIHGIGGAKYDQITDLVMFDLFGIDPPDFIALSQTTLLPIEADLITHADYAKQQQILREMHFHPEQFLEEGERSDPKVSSLKENKMEWIARSLSRGSRAERHRQIEKANAGLREFLHKKAEKQKKILRETEISLQNSRILGSREWSFCLFPESFLKSRLLDLNLSSF